MLKGPQAGKSAAFKKTLLKDLGPNWEANFVSIVDRPAVPKAKWFALKMADPEAASRPADDGRDVFGRVRDERAPARDVFGRVKIEKNLNRDVLGRSR